MINNIIHIPIVPVKLLHFLDDYKVQLALTHLCAIEEYKNYYKQKKREGKLKYLILDNSVIELGSYCQVDTIIATAADINADEVILPDILDNKEATINKVKETYKYFRLNLKTNVKLAAVTQGKTVQEHVQCAIEYLKLGIDVIHIPKRAAVIKPDARSIIAIEIDKQSMSKVVPIHFLGVWNSLIEIYNFYDQYQVEMKRFKVRSCDTQWAALLTKNRLDALEVQDTSLSIKPLLRENFIHKVISLSNTTSSALHPELLKRNLKKVDEIFNGNYWDPMMTLDEADESTVITKEDLIYINKLDNLEELSEGNGRE